MAKMRENLHRKQDGSALQVPIEVVSYPFGWRKHAGPCFVPFLKELARFLLQVVCPPRRDRKNTNPVAPVIDVGCLYKISA